MLIRRLFSIFAGCVIAMAFVSVHAQNWPEKPVRMVIGYSPGGTVDGWTRMLARRYEERFKQPFVVENRPGANATLATVAVAQAPADGYLISFIAMPTQGRNFQKNVTYDTLKDFEPLTGIYTAPYAFAVNAATGFRSVKEVIDAAKSSPGKLNFGTGVTTFKLIATLMQVTWGIDVVQVPYKGQAPALTALVANEVQMVLDQMAVLRGQADAGKIRIIGVTGESRSAMFPDAPSFSELGYPKLTFGGNSMLWARRGVPREVVEKINSATAEIIKLPEFVERLRLEGGQPVTASPAELWNRFLREYQFMDEAAKAAKFVPE